MKRRELARVKDLSKHLRGLKFRPMKKGALPRPFDKVGGARLSATGLIAVGNGLSVLFLVRDGEIVERRAFYGHLLRNEPEGLLPLAVLHYHPSHKGIHLLVNCDTDRDYLNRLLPGAPELALRTPSGIDPASEEGRLQLVNYFCDRCGIKIAPDDAQLI